MAEPGVTIDSGSFVVTTDNLDGYEADRTATTEALRKKFDGDLLKCS
jgi:ribose transport system substrate-binding protein